jgi:hypothetical protein
MQTQPSPVTASNAVKVKPHVPPGNGPQGLATDHSGQAPWQA